MKLTWPTVDRWRAERDMTRAELARRAGIPERTIYAGIRNEARLQAASTTVIRTIFPEKFNRNDEGL